MSDTPLDMSTTIMSPFVSTILSAQCSSPTPFFTQSDALLTLTPEHRAVLVECYYRGASVSQAAQRLGIPEGTVKSRLHYALENLREAQRGLNLSELWGDTEM